MRQYAKILPHRESNCFFKLVDITMEKMRNMQNNEIEIITNESGDWKILTLNEQVYTQGHNISDDTFVKLFNSLGIDSKITFITDEEMEDLC